uniref:ATP synthase complex subunit 8 n=1 Tax=Bufo stejnegeri TaxID=113378 RepID=A0A0K0WVC8_9NEOB|nr:ATP synthase F0 subunit 8 [Bufo stejnegeri]AKS28295.1 ATP synthase F0 subunit 8 [Bufo stejnegeri]
MPQLDPAPWFFILFSAWMVFILISPVKTSNYTLLNDPTPKPFKGLNKPWHWPWP